MRILLTGATGLVGQGVLRETLAHPGVSSVGLLGRRDEQRPMAPRDNLFSRLQQFDQVRPHLHLILPESSLPVQRNPIDNVSKYLSVSQNQSIEVPEHFHYLIFPEF